MKVLCYGDSNTYGYDPRSYYGGRYDAQYRWVDILASKTGWQIQNAGMNGREIPRQSDLIPDGTELLIVMLGTNDLLQGKCAEEACQRMESFLQNLDPEIVCLIAPPPMKPGEWVSSNALIGESKALSREYKALARRLGIRFLDAGGWNVELTFDGVHFSENGHIAFAEGLWKELVE